MRTRADGCARAREATPLPVYYSQSYSGYLDRLKEIRHLGVVYPDPYLDLYLDLMT